MAKTLNTKLSAQSRYICSRGTEGWDKGQIEKTEEEGAGEGNKGEDRKGAREMGQGCLSQTGTKGCLWVERRQTWHIGKCRFIKVQVGKPQVRMRCLILVRQVN